MPETDRDNAARLWRLYAHHAALLFSSGPRPSVQTTDRWFFAATGSDHVDMNQGALFGEASADDATLLANAVLDAGYRACSVVRTGCSSESRRPWRERVSSRSRIERRCSGGPARSSRQLPSAFDVRRVRSDADIAAMQAIFEEAHGYEPEAIARLYGDRVKGDDGFSAWLAWDGDEPVSFTIVIEVGASLSIWEVMTPKRHRRRGAARAVVTSALAGAAAVAARPIEETLFWSSPAGRPLYESMGFAIADHVDAWAIGASAEDLEAVGA